MLLSPRSVPDRVRARIRVCNDAGVVYRAENRAQPVEADAKRLIPRSSALGEEVGGRRTFGFHQGATV